jgi:hypothetical protein
MPQNTNHILMIRPATFGYNEQTAVSNAFQNVSAVSSDASEKALAEFDAFVVLLRQNGVQVWVVDDTEDPSKPDAIFPNNWFSSHDDSRIVLYPMQAENRRLERRADITHHLAEVFTMHDIVDYTAFEQEQKFLEGTGSMVLDRINKVCYACLSPRTDKEVLQAFCKEFGYSLVDFTATDRNGKLIYHTNVMMCIGERFMVVCLECVPDEKEKMRIRNSTRKTIIEISFNQVEHFAGNMLEVINDKGEKLIVMSQQAYGSLTASQAVQLQHFGKIIASPLTTIESIGGGSARCMMAEIFLPVKTV